MRQAEILCDVQEMRFDLEALRQEQYRLLPRSHDLAIVMTQDCDLDLDHRTRLGEVLGKTIAGVLLCYIFTAQEIRNAPEINAALWKSIRRNKHGRYQFLQGRAATDDSLGEGLPELCVDFKQYFTVPTEVLYLRIEQEKTRRRGRLVSPYLEHLSSRFAHYLSRVALPQQHLSD